MEGDDSCPLSACRPKSKRATKRKPVKTTHRTPLTQLSATRAPPDCFAGSACVFRRAGSLELVFDFDDCRLDKPISAPHEHTLALGFPELGTRSSGIFCALSQRSSRTCLRTIACVPMGCSSDGENSQVTRTTTAAGNVANARTEKGAMRRERRTWALRSRL